MDIYLAAIVVFVGRMFTNLSIIRRYYLDKWANRKVVAKAEAIVEANGEEKKED